MTKQPTCNYCKNPIPKPYKNYTIGGGYYYCNKKCNVASILHAAEYLQHGGDEMTINKALYISDKSEWEKRLSL